MYWTQRTFYVVAVLGAVFLLSGCSDSSSPTGPDEPPEDPGNGDTSVEFDSRAAPGDSARSFLTDRRFTVLSLEVDYMEGYEPTDAAFDSLKTALETHLNKSTIRVGPKSSIPAEGDSTYTSEQIVDLENEHRDHYTRAESDTLWAYFIVLDGKYSTENVVGLAYYNTSMAFFGETIDEISGGLSQPSQEKVEATVFRHEVGHNLGLVNNGIPQQQDHHDEEHGAHCDREQCVMHYTIETTDFYSNLLDQSIPSFEQFCTEDMAAQRGD